MLLGTVGGLCIGLVILLFLIPLTEWMVAGVAVGVFALTVMLFGFERRRFRERSSLIIVIISTAGIWLVLEYLLGIWLGFVRNRWDWSFFWATVVPLILTFFMTELMRANLVEKARRSRLAIVATWLLATLLGVAFAKTQYHLSSNLDLTEFIFIDILPWLAQSVFLTLLALRGGWVPAVIFCGLTQLPRLILPFYPALDAYLLGVANLLLPVMMFYLVRRITKERNVPEYSNQIWRALSYACLVLLIGSTVAISSGLFKYYPLVIASGSMLPNIGVGDFVIVKKLAGEELGELMVGDILVFRKSSRIIVHRIVEIGALVDDPTFITKGDANQDNDSWVVEAGEVIGTTGLRLPRVGYPTLWVHDLLKDSGR